MTTYDDCLAAYFDTPEPLKTKLAAALFKRNTAIESAKKIPSWATWTEAEADIWYQANVRDPFTSATTLAAMKAVVGTLIVVQWATIRMVLALRNHAWPDL